MTPTAPTAERLLALWLRLGGVVCASAIIAALMPRDWHAAAHTALGLGEFPAAPIAEYLARGMSGLCAFYGVLLIALATDVRRYLPIIVAQAITLVVISQTATLVLLSSGMPAWWLYGDFFSVCGFSAVVLLLARAVFQRPR